MDVYAVFGEGGDDSVSAGKEEPEANAADLVERVTTNTEQDLTSIVEDNDVFEDNEAVVDFWLHGAYLEVLGDPDPYSATMDAIAHTSSSGTDVRPTGVTWATSSAPSSTGWCGRASTS